MGSHRLSSCPPVVLALALLFLAGCEEDTASPNTPPVLEWSLQAGGGLADVWGISGNDVFAVGGEGRILHYNGAAWNSMTSGTSAWLGVCGQLRERRVRRGT